MLQKKIKQGNNFNGSFYNEVKNVLLTGQI